VDLAHHRQGRGTLLVLLHGIGSRWQVWLPVLDRLAERHDVIAVDLPGFGASPAWPPGRPAPGSVPHLAGLVAEFLDGLGVREPAVAGSSLGGGIALELGRRGLARAVTAFSPVGFFTGAQARWCRAVVSAARATATRLEPALPALMSTRAGRIGLCGAFYGRPGSLPAAACVADARALIAAPGFTAARRELGGWRLGPGHLEQVPVTVAWGTRDLVLPYRPQAARARAVLPHARHLRLPGCGHLPFADDPGSCAAAILGTGSTGRDPGDGS
jgi:pimeloyl-ACP methyl ester carboxylesterase